MSSAMTHFKLGLFALVGIAAVIATAFILGAWTMSGERIHYHTYFDESVQGLELGAPVKYRGVLIGSVDAIEVAPDQHHVDVKMGLDAKSVKTIGLDHVASDLRAQLNTQGITGVKYVNIDVFDPKLFPPPDLGFPPSHHYIPAAPSLMKGLEENVSLLAEKLPALVESTTVTLQKVNVILDDFHGEHVPARLAKTIDDIDLAVGDMRTLVKHVDRANIPQKTADAIDQLDLALKHATNVLARLDGDGGLVASTQRATEAVGDLGRQTSRSTDDLERTLRDLDEAAQAIRDLAQAIERDPDMLVSGRASPKKRER